MPESSATAAAAAQRLSPFDQILERERADEQLLHDAMAALEQERIAGEDALRTRQAHEIDQARSKAREELLEYKNTHLPQILKESAAHAARERERIEREGASRVDAAATIVVDTALSDILPSLL